MVCTTDEARPRSAKASSKAVWDEARVTAKAPTALAATWTVMSLRRSTMSPNGTRRTSPRRYPAWDDATIQPMLATEISMSALMRSKSGWP
ncbi:hypothetical protein D3C73_1011840 [compost metagenome]